jgi:hypothetical protein
MIVYVFSICGLINLISHNIFGVILSIIGVLASSVFVNKIQGQLIFFLFVYMVIVMFFSVYAVIYFK